MESLGRASKMESLGRASKMESLGRASKMESLGRASKMESLGRASKMEFLGRASKMESVLTERDDLKLLEKMRSILPGYSIPDEVVMVQHFPLTHHGNAQTTPISLKIYNLLFTGKVDVNSLLNKTADMRRDHHHYGNPSVTHDDKDLSTSITYLLVTVVTSLTTIETCSGKTRLISSGATSFDIVRIANQMELELERLYKLTDNGALHFPELTNNDPLHLPELTDNGPLHLPEPTNNGPLHLPELTNNGPLHLPELVEKLLDQDVDSVVCYILEELPGLIRSKSPGEFISRKRHSSSSLSDISPASKVLKSSPRDSGVSGRSCAGHVTVTSHVEVQSWRRGKFYVNGRCALIRSMNTRDYKKNWYVDLGREGLGRKGGIERGEGGTGGKGGIERGEGGAGEGLEREEGEGGIREGLYNDKSRRSRKVVVK